MIPCGLSWVSSSTVYEGPPKFWPVQLILVPSPGRVGLSQGFGLIFIALVMFLPYGIVGTWQRRSLQIKRGWKQLVGLLRR